MIREEDMNEMQYRMMQDQATAGQINSTSQSLQIQDAERSMAKDQLDLSEELERIEHLLRGHVIEYDEATGNKRWVEPKDNDMVVLSEYGIHLILNTITWYINKNTLLSNYDEQTILTKMEDFASDLADTIFMEYEKVFQYPSLEDCKKIFEGRIKYKTELRMFAGETAGIKMDEKKERDKIIKEVEETIEKELDKIKQQIIKSKLKRFLMLMRIIQDSVHSTYLRAYKGMERKTLREHIHITETMGGVSGRSQQQGSGWSPLNWLRKQN